MLNIGKEYTPKDDQTNILVPTKVSQGTHVVYRNTNDEGETYFMVARKFKIYHVKRKKRKNNFITSMIFTDLYITIPGEPEPKRYIICVEGLIHQRKLFFPRYARYTTRNIPHMT